MCRMCSFYIKLDIKQLPLSNPFLDDMTPTPTEVELPNNIVVESPESGIHTAWTNVRRFPSLHQQNLSAGTRTSQQITTRTISINGPRELAKQDQFSYVAFHPQPRSNKPPHQNSAVVLNQHRLPQHNRIDSFPDAMVEKIMSEKSSQNLTPRSISPASMSSYHDDDDDDEFSYLPSSPKVARTFSPRIVAVKQSPKRAGASELPYPEPLRIKYKEQGSAR